MQNEQYTLNSFLSYAYYYADPIKEKDLKDIASRIQSTLNDNVIALNITNESTLPSSSGTRIFKIYQQLYCLESKCYVPISTSMYEVTIIFDYTYLKELENDIWVAYTIYSIISSLLIGIVLFYLSKKISLPLANLSSAVEAISDGHYGEHVNIKSNELEIQTLIDNFNKMSDDTKKAMDHLVIEANKQKQFTANFSHELKTPLTTIIGYADLIKNYDLSSDEKEEAITSIITESKRLDKLSQQLLVLFVFQNQNIVLERISLLNLKDKMVSTCNILSEKYNVGYDIFIHDAYVLANEELLLSLMYNLIDNAFKVSSIDQKIKIYTTHTQTDITIFVDDSGAGIDEVHLSHLFDPFYRVDNARSRTKGGNGIGLALAQEIARLHHSEIKVKSELNVGTCFYFTLKKVGDISE